MTPDEIGLAQNIAREVRRALYERGWAACDCETVEAFTRDAALDALSTLQQEQADVVDSLAASEADVMRLTAQRDAAEADAARLTAERDEAMRAINGNALAAVRIADNRAQIAADRDALIECAERLEADAARLREALEDLARDRVEWLCERCHVVHPSQRDGFLQPCPVCKTAMLPTSLALRERHAAREEAIRLREAATPAVDALNEAWNDLHEWRRLAQEQRRAHPDPNHAANMPHEAGIRRTQELIDRIGRASTELRNALAPAAPFTAQETRE